MRNVQVLCKDCNLKRGATRVDGGPATTTSPRGSYICAVSLGRRGRLGGPRWGACGAGWQVPHFAESVR